MLNNKLDTYIHMNTWLYEQSENAFYTVYVRQYSIALSPCRPPLCKLLYMYTSWYSSYI